MVSIHAPTRGATLLSIEQSFPFAFQSTHPHGVRRLFSSHAAGDSGFNPRTHTGCDDITAFKPVLTDVSFHAPTRGATHRRS